MSPVTLPRSSIKTSVPVYSFLAFSLAVLCWLSVPEIKEKTDVYLRLRSSQEPFEATLIPLEGHEVKLVFHTPQKAVAKGQSAVFYDENGFVLGGGIIKSA